MGLFSSGGMTSVNTLARLQNEKNTREIAKLLKNQQNQPNRPQACTESARIQWCIDRITQLEAEVISLRGRLDAEGDAT